MVIVDFVVITNVTALADVSVPHRYRRPYTSRGMAAIVGEDQQRGTVLVWKRQPDFLFSGRGEDTTADMEITQEQLAKILKGLQLTTPHYSPNPLLKSSILQRERIIMFNDEASPNLERNSKMFIKAYGDSRP